MRRKILATTIFITSIVILSSNSWSSDVVSYWLNVNKIDGYERPNVIGLTNLPKGTEVHIDMIGKDYLSKCVVPVVDTEKYGYDYKSSFTYKTPLPPGEYEFIVYIPIATFTSINGDTSKTINIIEDKVIYYKEKHKIVKWNRVSNAPWGDFKGIPFGAPVGIARDKINGLDCYENEEYAECNNVVSSIGKAEIESSSMTFNKYGLVSVYLKFKSDDYGYLKSLFVVKYGKPNSAKANVVQNRMGAKYGNQLLEWDDGKVSLVLEKYGNTIEDGMIYFITNKEIKRREAENKKEKTDALKDL